MSFLLSQSENNPDKSYDVWDQSKTVPDLTNAEGSRDLRRILKEREQEEHNRARVSSSALEQEENPEDSGEVGSKEPKLVVVNKDELIRTLPRRIQCSVKVMDVRREAPLSRSKSSRGERHARTAAVPC